MKWYRVGLTANSKERTCEIQAHDSSDAFMVAAVKLKLIGVADLKLTTFECVDPPAWARAAVDAAEKAFGEQ